jgi:hypothetical protein
MVLSLTLWLLDRSLARRTASVLARISHKE